MLREFLSRWVIGIGVTIGAICISLIAWQRQAIFPTMVAILVPIAGGAWCVNIYLERSLTRAQWSLLLVPPLLTSFVLVGTWDCRETFHYWWGATILSLFTAASCWFALREERTA